MSTTQNDFEYTLEFSASNYSGGYTLNINIMNIGNTPISNWTFNFEFPGDEMIISFWNVSTWSQDGATVTASSADWNDPISPGSTITIGLSVTSSRAFSNLMNPMINGERPIVFTGNLRVTMEMPAETFPFTPEVTVANKTENISFGSTFTFMDLTANTNYTVTSNVFIDDNFIYSPTITPNPVLVPPNETVDVSISYTKNEKNPNIFGGYFASWSDRYAGNGADTDLANLPSYVNVVYVAFGVPDMNYQGDLNLQGTGMSFSYPGTVLKEAISVLKTRNPQTKVILSIGGETYTNWDAFNPANIALCIKDFGFDGIDIDYEPAGGFICMPDSTGMVSCNSDQAYINLVRTAREHMPRPLIITAAPFSVGAYGEGQWLDAPPANLATTGMFLNIMREVGNMLDYVNVQGYNAGASYNPLEGTQAYFNYFGPGILMGAHVPPEAYGDHVWTVAEINRVGSYINQNGIGGMMMWQLYRTNSNPSDNFPDNQIMASAIARVLGFPNYEDPLFPLRNPS